MGGRWAPRLTLSRASSESREIGPALTRTCCAVLAEGLSLSCRLRRNVRNRCGRGDRVGILSVKSHPGLDLVSAWCSACVTLCPDLRVLGFSLAVTARVLSLGLLRKRSPGCVFFFCDLNRINSEGAKFVWSASLFFAGLLPNVNACLLFP